MALVWLPVSSTLHVERHKADQPRRQYSFREFRVDMLGKVMTFGMILVAAVEAVMPGTVPESGMILVLLVGANILVAYRHNHDAIAAQSTLVLLAVGSTAGTEFGEVGVAGPA